MAMPAYKKSWRVLTAVSVGMLVALSGVATQLHAQDLAANKRLVRRYFEEAINERRPEVVDSIFGPAYHAHFLETGESRKSSATAVKRFLPALFEAFPDIRYTVEDIIAEGDRVMIRLTANGTQQKELFGIPSAGRKLDNLSEIFIFRVENGRIVEGWRLVDFAGLQKRLGSRPDRP